MTWLLAFIPSWLRWALVGLAGACALFQGAYTIGKHEGRQQAAVAALEAINKAYKDRNDENASVEALDPVSLCVELGGMLSDCRASLRGMAEDHGPASDGGLSGGQ
jgi:hypothetical protein